MKRVSSALFGASLLLACGPPSAASSDSMTASEDASGTDPSDTDPSDTDTDTDTEESAVWLPPDDAPPNVGACDLFEQDCPVGEKCVPFNDGGLWGEQFKCVPVLGDQAAGDPCTSTGEAEATDDCDATSYCWGYGEDLVGQCMAFCMGSLESAECPPMSVCQNYLWICQPYCDPLAPDACPPGSGCYWAGSTFACLETGDPAEPGQPCSQLDDCTPGSACLDASVFPDCAGPSCCAAFCDLELGDAGCEAAPGTSCVAFFEQGQAPAGLEQVGVCIVP